MRSASALTLLTCLAYGSTVIQALPVNLLSEDAALVERDVDANDMVEARAPFNFDDLEIRAKKSRARKSTASKRKPNSRKPNRPANKPKPKLSVSKFVIGANAAAGAVAAVGLAAGTITQALPVANVNSPPVATHQAPVVDSTELVGEEFVARMGFDFEDEALLERIVAPSTGGTASASSATPSSSTTATTSVIASSVSSSKATATSVVSPSIKAPATKAAPSKPTATEGKKTRGKYAVDRRPKGVRHHGRHRPHNRHPSHRDHRGRRGGVGRHHRGSDHDGQRTRYPTSGHRGGERSRSRGGRNRGNGKGHEGESGRLRKTNTVKPSAVSTTTSASATPSASATTTSASQAAQSSLAPRP